MTHRFRLAFIGAALALLPVSGFTQTYDPAWARHDGEITVSDPDNAARPGTKWDLFSLTGVSAGATVHLYMKAGTLADPYLQVTDSNGVVITEDDDSGAGASDGSYHGSGLDAYVVFTFQPGYEIRATTYSPFSSGGAGTYQLYLSAGSVVDIGSNNDTEPPTISSVTSSSANGTYQVGDSISIQVVFSEAVTVTGTPLLTLNSGGTASYASGSGTTTLTFLYTIGAGHSAADLDYSATNALALSGGTIKDAASNNGTLTLPTVGGANSLGGQKAIVIDGVAPTVSSVQVPTNGTYTAGQNLDFTVNLSETVIVNTAGGTPYLSLTLDTGGSVQVTYISGSGTSALTFRYTIASGNLDGNGVALGASLVANGGTVRDAAGNGATLTLNSVGSTTGVLVDGVAPSVGSINRTTSALTNAASIEFSVTFSENVTGVDTSDFSLTTTGSASATISAVSAANGATYTVTVSSTSGDGTIRLDLNSSGTGITDVPGNPISGGFSAGQTYTLDRVAPAAPTISSLSTDTGASSSDGITNDTTPAFSGTAEAHGTVEVFRGGTSLGTATVDGSGQWSFTAAAQAEGTYSITARSTDTAGNTSAASSALTVTIDTTEPTAPVINSISDDTGISSTDQITSDTTLVLSGTAEGNSIVTVSRLGIGSLGTTTADGSGNWSFDYTTTTLAAGEHTFTATAADLAGNASIASGSFIVTIDTTPPTIGTPPAGGTYSAGDTFNLSVSANDSATLSYQWYLGGTPLADGSNRSGAATATVTHTGIGTIGFAGDYTVVITDLAGNSTTSAPATVVVNKADQTITFPSIADQLTTSDPFTVSATASTGFTVTFSVVSGPATLSGNTVTITGAGTVTLRATQAGDINYNSASADRTFAATKATATVNLGGSTFTYDGSPKSVVTTITPAGLTVDLTYNGSTSAPTDAGSYTVVATITDPLYQGSASGTLVIGKASQTIAFNSVTAPTIGSPIALHATASSDLPVTFSVVSGPATLSGSSLTITDSGAVTVRASQAGSGNYTSASIDQTIADAAKTAQTITFAALPDRNASDAPFTLVATASSGLPVSFSIVSGPAIRNGSTLALTGAPGHVTVRADQAGNSVYHAAAPVSHSFEVRPVGPLVYFGQLGAGEEAQELAAEISTDGRFGTLIGVIPGTGEGFVVIFEVGANGAWRATARTFGNPASSAAAASLALGDGGSIANRNRIAKATDGTLTFGGFAEGGVLTGTIDELGLSFTAQLQPPVGPTATIAGYYEAPSLNSTTGSTYSVVGTEGRIYVLVITASAVAGSSGSITPDGSFQVQAAQSIAIAGRVNATSTAVTGSVTLPSGASESFSGVRESTLRTDRLINLSTRARVAADGGAGTLITGFVIGGSSPKTVLLRGVGPSLSAFGLSNVLADPRLRVFNAAGQVIAENDNWGGTAELAAAMTRVGAFALPAASKDAALLLDLAPGVYSVHVLNGGQGGIALAEIYDAAANPQSEYQRLINISSRGLVATGDGVLIGGFAVTGNAPKRVLIRGAGPALTAYNVPGVLADPQIRLYNSAGTIIAENNDWTAPIIVAATQTSATAAEITAANGAVGAFAFTDGSKDAALVVTLAPGNYTVHLSGVANTTGVGLIEIYEITP